MFDHVGRTSDPDGRTRTVKSMAITSALGFLCMGAVVSATWFVVVEPLVQPEPQQWVEMVDLPPDAEPGQPPAAPIRKGVAEPDPSEAQPDPMENRAYNVLPDKSQVVGNPQGTGTTDNGSPTGTPTGKALTRHPGTGGGGGGPISVSQGALDVLHRVDPVFPNVAKQIGLSHARCVATVKISERGRVESVHVDQCQAAFHGETIRALSKWRFAPYMVAGQAVPAQTRIAIVYTMK